MKHKILILSFILLTASCRNTLNETIILPQAEVQSPVIISDSLVIVPPLNMEDLGAFLLFSTPGMSDNILFFEKNTHKTYSWGKTGNGPDDYSIARFSGKRGNKIRLFDSNLKKCVEYELNTSNIPELTPQKRWQIEQDSIILTDIHWMQNGYSVGYIGYGSNRLFALLDEDLNFLTTFADRPINDMPNSNNLQMFGWFASYENKLFFACQSYGYMVCYEVKGSNAISKEWEITFSKPLYDADSKKWEKENLLGFYDIKANADYIFVPFSNKSYANGGKVTPQYILVLTHQGEIVKNITIPDKYFSKISVSDNKGLYIYGNDLLMYDDWSNW